MEIYILFTILIIASVWDLIKFKIPNALVLFTALMGIIYSTYFGGWGGFAESSLGLLLTFLVFLPAWLFFGMGAGDVKLLMALATFIGLGNTLYVGLYAIIISSVIFIFWVNPKRILKMFKDYFYLLFYKIPLLSERNAKKKLPFALMITLSFAAQVYFHQIV
jgi:prepilin peptidase CpaA